MQQVTPADRPATRVVLIFATLAALLALALGAPRQAAAGQYTIFSCQADEAGYASAAFENFATRGMKWRRACNPLGRGLRGLVTANVARAGRVKRGAQSGFVLAAPPGTTFSRLRWSGHARRRDCRYALQLYAERPGQPPVAIKNVRANRSCPRRNLAQASSWPRPRAYDLGAATRIIQRVVCVGSHSRRFCSSRGQNYIRTFAAEATVVDAIAPSAAVVPDTPLARGEWVSGRHAFTYNAIDNVGVKSAYGRLSGAPNGNDSRACSYSQRIPCPSGLGGIEVDTGRAPEGSQPMTVVAEDAAGNIAESPPVTVRIDNTAPGAVPVGVEGGETWRNQNDFDLSWTNPVEGDRAPIVAAHYRLCRVGSDDCVSGDRAAAGIARLDDLTVSSPGEWELRMWRQDAAGNQQPSNASLPVRMRYDPEPPELGFEAPSVADPTRVSVLVTDRISGLSGGIIEISPVGSGIWQALPTTREGDRLITRIDDAAMPPGDYELRASARDQASNLASSAQRLDGQPMRVRLPLRIATSMKAGILRKRTVLRTVKRKGEKRKVKRKVSVLKPRGTVGFGQRVRFAGRLLNRAGHPLAGATLHVYSRPREGGEQLAGTVATDSNGRFAYVVEGRASGRFRFVYPGTATILPVEGVVDLRVKADSSFRAKPMHVLNGNSVTFSGKVRGQPLPEAGKLIELQYEASQKEWQTFRTLRSRPDGSWRLVYRIRRTCGLRKFSFRAHLPGEARYPLEPGNSRSLTVRVRGRPCFG